MRETLFIQFNLLPRNNLVIFTLLVIKKLERSEKKILMTNERKLVDYMM